MRFFTVYVVMPCHANQCAFHFKIQATWGDKVYSYLHVLIAEWVFAAFPVVGFSLSHAGWDGVNVHLVSVLLVHVKLHTWNMHACTHAHTHAHTHTNFNTTQCADQSPNPDVHRQQPQQHIGQETLILPLWFLSISNFTPETHTHTHTHTHTRTIHLSTSDFTPAIHRAAST